MPAAIKLGVTSTTTSPRSVRLKDGTEIVIRQIAPEDKRVLKGAFDRLSEESRFRRFLSPKNQLTQAELAFLTEVDHHDHEAVVAVRPREDEGIGVARFVRSERSPEVAEVAVTVANDWQHRGVGTALLAELVERARSVGVRRFSAVVHSSNRPMFELLQQLGAVVDRSRDGDTVEIELELPAREGVGTQLESALRAAATGHLTMAFMLPSGMMLSNRFWARLYAREGDRGN